MNSPAEAAAGHFTISVRATFPPWEWSGWDGPYKPMFWIARNEELRLRAVAIVQADVERRQLVRLKRLTGRA